MDNLKRSVFFRGAVWAILLAPFFVVIFCVLAWLMKPGMAVLVFLYLGTCVWLWQRPESQIVVFMHAMFWSILVYYLSPWIIVWLRWEFSLSIFCALAFLLTIVFFSLQCLLQKNAKEHKRRIFVRSLVAEVMSGVKINLPVEEKSQ